MLFWHYKSVASPQATARKRQGVIGMKTTVEYQPMQAPLGLNLSWRTAIIGEMRSLGVRYSVGLLDYSGSRESTFLIPDAFFGCSLESNVSEVSEYAMDDYRDKRFEYSNAAQLCLYLLAGEPLSTVGESDRKSVLDPPSAGGEMLVVPAREKKSLLTSAEHDRGGLK
jgi:hypothetical protein